MLRLARPTANDVDALVDECSRLDLMQTEFLASRKGLKAPRLPAGFAHDYSYGYLGNGTGVFEAAVRAFENWKQFDLGWVRVANNDVAIEAGNVVMVEIHSLGLWSLNLSQIVEVTRNSDGMGFIYKTTANHVEQGEERFFLTFNERTGEVHYELEAVSKPQHWLARVGYPYARAFQHKFARESHRRIREIVAGKF